MLTLLSRKVVLYPVQSTKDQSNVLNEKSIFGNYLGKIPQDVTVNRSVRQEILAKAFFPQLHGLCQGCSNQIAKFLYPLKQKPEMNSDWSTGNFISLPVLKQPYDRYKMLVVTAPENIQYSEDPMVIYVILPDDLQGINRVPKIYFVHSKSGKIDITSTKTEPVLMINNNRTVTGIKSKEMSKYIKFRSKFANKLFNKNNVQLI